MFFSALLCLSVTLSFCLGGNWGLPEEAERLACINPSTSTRSPSNLALTLDGVSLDDDASSVEGAVLD